jgi:hypothetical protein
MKARLGSRADGRDLATAIDASCRGSRAWAAATAAMSAAANEMSRFQANVVKHACR